MVPSGAAGCSWVLVWSGCSSRLSAPCAPRRTVTGWGGLFKTHSRGTPSASRRKGLWVSLSLPTSGAFSADLEQLYLGLHYSDSNHSRSLEGSRLLTWKWRHSLRELDLTSQSFSQEDLEQAMAAFTQGGGEGGAPLLRSLSLTGTKIALRTVRTLIASCPALSYLNLSSCRQLPRGTKKIYRSPDEIRQCLHQLSATSEDPETPGGPV